MSRNSVVAKVPQMQDLFPIAPEFPSILMEDVSNRLVELEIITDYYKRVIDKLAALPNDLYVLEYNSPISVNRGISLKMVL